MKHLSLFLLLFGLFTSSSAFAGWSHGGDIRWAEFGNDSLKVDVTLYRDCNGINVSEMPLRVSSNCGSSSVRFSYSTARDITPTCETVASKCANRNSSSFDHGIQETVLTYFFSLTDFKKNSCCTVNFSWSLANRSSSITTGGANNRFYIEASANICGSLASVEWLQEPKAFACMGRDFSSPSFMIKTDSASDSIVYSWAEPLQNATSKTTWGSPFSYDKPISFLGFPKTTKKFPQGLHLNAQTGRLLFRPTKEEVTILKVQAAIYRRGVWQGTVSRDQILIVQKCDNEAPLLSTITNCQLRKDFALSDEESQKMVCAGDSFSFTICTYDKDRNDSVSLSYEHSIPGLTVSFDKSNPTREKAVVTWTPTEAQAKDEPYTLTLKANDHACPTVGEDLQQYKIFVKPKANIKLDIEDQGCGIYRFTTTEKDSQSLDYAYPIISRDVADYLKKSLGIFSDTTWFKFKKPGSYEPLIVTSGKGFCNDQFSENITVADNFFQIRLTTDSIKACEGDSIRIAPILINAKATPTYTWTNDQSKVLDSIEIGRFTVVDSLYHLRVTGNDDGCEASDEVVIKAHLKPHITLPQLAYTCAKDSIYLPLQIQHGRYQDSISSIQWTDSLKNPIANDGLAFFTKTPGQYLLDITTVNNCKIIDTIAVRVVTPKFEITGDSISCEKDLVTLEVTSKQQGRYYWSIGGTLENPDLILLNPVYQVTSKISETVRLIFTTTKNAYCTDTKTINLTVLPQPVFNVSNPMELCQGDSALLTANMLSTWTLPNRTVDATSVWYKADEAMAAPKRHVIYFTATTALGCSKDSSIGIFHNESPVSIFSFPDSVQRKKDFTPNNNSSLDINYSYQWLVGSPVFDTFIGYAPNMFIDSVGLFDVQLDINNPLTGCMGTSQNQIKIFDLIAVPEVLKPAHLSIYPNPANHVLHIEWKDAEFFTWNLSNAQGQQLMEETYKGASTSIPIQHLPEGIYLVRVERDNLHLVQILVVTH